MSLINDALKRASQSDRNRPRPPQTHDSMRPAAGGSGQSFWLAWVIGIILALGLAGWFFGQGWRASHQPPPPAKVETIAAATPAPIPPPREAVAPVAVAPAPVPVPPPAPPPPAKPVPEPWPADLKLMGIFFSKTNPRALINGKTVSAGDEIEGIVVTRIEHDQVTVEWKGQSKTLVIE